MLSAVCVSGDVSAEDPLHGAVHGADAQPLSEPPAVVLRLPAVWRSHAGAVDAAAGHQSPGTRDHSDQNRHRVTKPAFM